MKIELADCTNTLLREIEMKETTRKYLANTYALAIMSSEKTDWGKVNKAIVKRWSKNGLGYIKGLAWNIVQKGSANYD